jgi:hypothetical protein
MRCRILLAFACLVASDISAQSSAPPPPNPVIMQFVRFADIFGSRLVAAFESIPESQYAYRPTPTQQTVGYIAQHLEDANYSLCGQLGGARPPRTSPDSLADTIKARWPKDTLITRLKTSLLFCDEAVLRLRELISPTITSTLLAFETDLAEHYAQIASYMRMLGLVPPSALLPRRRTAITLSEAVLSPLVGIYEISPGWEIVVAMRNGALTITSSLGGAPVSLLPESPTDFFVNEVDAQVTFIRNTDGSVNGLVLHQYGRNRPARKIR